MRLVKQKFSHIGKKSYTGFRVVSGNRITGRTFFSGGRTKKEAYKNFRSSLRNIT